LISANSKVDLTTELNSILSLVHWRYWVQTKYYLDKWRDDPAD